MPVFKRIVLPKNTNFPAKEVTELGERYPCFSSNDKGKLEKLVRDPALMLKQPVASVKAQHVRRYELAAELEKSEVLCPWYKRTNQCQFRHLLPAQVTKAAEDPQIAFHLLMEVLIKWQQFHINFHLLGGDGKDFDNIKIKEEAQKIIGRGDDAKYELQELDRKELTLTQIPTFVLDNFALRSKEVKLRAQLRNEVSFISETGSGSGKVTTVATVECEKYKEQHRQGGIPLCQTIRLDDIPSEEISKKVWSALLKEHEAHWKEHKTTMNRERLAYIIGVCNDFKISVEQKLKEQVS